MIPGRFSILVVIKGAPNKLPIVVPIESEINIFFISFDLILFNFKELEDKGSKLLVVVKNRAIKNENMRWGELNAPTKSKFNIVGIINSGF